MGAAVLIKRRRAFHPTIDLHVSFLAPAMPGSFTGEVRVVQPGKPIAFVEGALFDADGTPVARATASARVAPVTRLP